MGWRLNRTKQELAVWKHVKLSRRGLTHTYVDFFVEANRYMPYTKGHVEAILWILIVIGHLWLIM